MAKDDYHVIVYQILSYLYVQLKSGEQVDGRLLEHDSKYLNINERYWQYIMINLLNDGYISGITISKAWGKDVFISDLDCCQITPKGIEFLTDNSFINKAKDFLKDIKAIVPFV